MDDLVRFLTLHLELGPDLTSGLTPYVTRARFEAGETLHARGAVCTDVILFMDGLVRVFYVHEAREVNLRLIRGPAAAVALSSLITSAPAEETVAAITEVTGYRIRLRDFEAASPGSLLVERARRVLAEQHYLSMERRLRTLQHKSARERYLYFREHMEPEIVQGVPGYHVASYLGISPESLSRVRAALARGS